MKQEWATYNFNYSLVQFMYVVFQKNCWVSMSMSSKWILQLCYFNLNIKAWMSLDLSFCIRKRFISNKPSNGKLSGLNSLLLSNNKNYRLTKDSCLKSIIGRILKSLIIIYRFWILKIAAFSADIGYLFKPLSNHLTTLIPKNLENIRNFEG